MNKREIVSMILAGGQGSRLGILTKKLAKPAIPFGGKYRIIDFTLSNCSNSGIHTVGVLTQYRPLELNSHIGIGRPWDLDRKDGGVYILPPYQEENGGDWYKGTADSIYQNISFIDKYDPEYVIVLSGDHIYKMNYADMLAFHKEKGADVTIAVTEVPIEETHRFGIMNTKEDMRIYEFEEKPVKAKSTKASMGVYIFEWKLLKEFLMADADDRNSSHDFGKDIIPGMLNLGVKIYAYPFKGYWKDVGTIESLWEANMDLLNRNNNLDLRDDSWKIYSINNLEPAQYIGPNANIKSSITVDGCEIYGEVINSIISSGSIIGENSRVVDSVIMPNSIIEDNVIINKALIGSNTVIRRNGIIGDGERIIAIGQDEDIFTQTLKKIII